MLYMNHLFFFRKKNYFQLPQKKIVPPNKNIIMKKNFIKPKHSFRQGLLTRLANPAGCGCGK